jgi:hypothetical protein
METDLLCALAARVKKSRRAVLAILNEKHYYPFHLNCIWRARESNQAGGHASALQHSIP